MRQLIEQHAVIAILRNLPDAHLLDYTGAVVAGHVGAIEVALNTKTALQQIARLKEVYGKSVAVGAGTVLTVAQAREAVAAGADFLLSPSVNPDVLAYCTDNGIRLLPGVMTPTDVATCLQYGIDLMKLFPAGSLPADWVKLLKGPFDSTDYIAVGGVSINTVADFFKAGCIGVGVGGNLIHPKTVQKGDWAQATKEVQAFVDAVKMARNQSIQQKTL